MRSLAGLIALAGLAAAACGQGRMRLAMPPVTLTVGGFQADYGSIQDAVRAAPEGGAVIRIRPGVYREVVRVEKPGIQLRGEGHDPAKVVLVFANGRAKPCGLSCSATLLVTGNDFYAEGLTVQNDLNKPGEAAVALWLTGDRAVLRDVLLLGTEGTVMAGSKPCPDSVGCATSRQFFEECTIVGRTNLVFGDSKAVFHACELRSLLEADGPLTSQTGGLNSGYVFEYCRLTAAQETGRVYLGQSAGDGAPVVFLHTAMGSHIQPEVLMPHGGETVQEQTATFAEYDSSGPGAKSNGRGTVTKHLTASEALSYSPGVFLRGTDGWDPAHIR